MNHWMSTSTGHDSGGSAMWQEGQEGRHAWFSICCWHVCWRCCSEQVRHTISVAMERLLHSIKAVAHTFLRCAHSVGKTPLRAKQNATRLPSTGANTRGVRNMPGRRTWTGRDGSAINHIVSRRSTAPRIDRALPLCVKGVRAHAYHRAVPPQVFAACRALALCGPPHWR